MSHTHLQCVQLGILDSQYRRLILLDLPGCPMISNAFQWFWRVPAPADPPKSGAHSAASGRDA